MGNGETKYQRGGRARGPGRYFLWPAVLSVAALAAACAGGHGNASEGRLRVVTSLELFADLVRQVGGERVEVSALLPSGADPHTFELAPRRVAEIARADLVFVNGLGLEASFEDVIRNNPSGPVLELAEGLPVMEGGDEREEEGGEEHLKGNPHLWLDVRNAMRYVERIRDALIQEDATAREEYAANAEAYLAQLDELDREMEAAVESISPERRKLVTFHDAFAYLASRYGLEVVAVVVPSPGQEPSAQDVAELTETMHSEAVPAVFKEPQFNARVLELAAGDAGVRVLDLLSDAYAEGVDSYLELMRFNLRQLQEGLGGD